MVFSEGTIVSAAQYKIDKQVFGFYLGESKTSLLSRAKTNGINYYQTDPIHKNCESYIFKQSMNKSGLCNKIEVNIYKDYVMTVDIYLKDTSKSHMEQVSNEISKSWKIAPNKSEMSSFGVKFSIYRFDTNDVKITLHRTTGGVNGTTLDILYWNNKLVKKYDSEYKASNKKTLTAEQF